MLSDPIRRKIYDQNRGHQIKINSSDRNYHTQAHIDPQPEPLIPEQSTNLAEEIYLDDSFQTYQPGFDSIFARWFSNFFEHDHPKSEQIESLNVDIAISPEQAERGGTAKIFLPLQATCLICHGYGGVGFFECWNCSGKGAIIQEQAILVNFPAGIANNFSKVLSLNRFGIKNFYLTLHFRVGQLF